ncbi:hypothetical protein UPYG_G00197940 [Umbra pygmaea]|uniref:RIIa domain-containing protein n=1 Tax=Umbra pygmaea TaxID=75934 RepID=A0ABD0WHK0_UMBPY
MSVPFSNTHLRVPRGFGNILEGLAREVLRDQPKDIPAFAARYFTALLKEREDSGLDPAEWSARLEDRFYNNHAFTKAPNPVNTNPEKDETLKKSEEKVKLTNLQTENEPDNIRSDGIPLPTTPNLNIFEDQGTENQEKYEMDHITDRYVTSTQIDPSSNEMNAYTEEESEIDKIKKEATDISSQVKMTQDERAEQDIYQSEFEPSEEISLRGLSNVDMCPQELGKNEDDEEHTFQEISTGDDEILETSNQENRSSEFELTQDISYTGLSDLDVCAEELRGTEESQEQSTAEDGLSGNFKDQDLDDALESSVLLLDPTIEPILTAQTESPELSDHSGGVPDKEDIEKLIVPTKYTGETYIDDASRVFPVHKGVLGDNEELKEKSLIQISTEEVPETLEVVTDEEHPEMDELSHVNVVSEDGEEETGLFTQNPFANVTDMNEEDEVATAEVDAQVEAMEQEAADIEKEKDDEYDSNDSRDEDEEKRSKLNFGTADQQTSEIEYKQEDEADHENKDVNREEIDDQLDSVDIETRYEDESDKAHINDDDMGIEGKYISHTYQGDTSEGETNDLAEKVEDDDHDHSDEEMQSSDIFRTSQNNIPETKEKDYDLNMDGNIQDLPDRTDQESEISSEELPREDPENITEQQKNTDAVDYMEDKEIEVEGLDKEDTMSPSQTDPADENPEGELKGVVDHEGNTEDDLK